MTRMAATTTVNVRLPKEVVEILDTLVERQLFLSRSEAIREFCRDYVRGTTIASGDATPSHRQAEPTDSVTRRKRR